MLEYLMIVALLLGLAECRGRDLRYYSSYYYYYSDYSYYDYYYYNYFDPTPVVVPIPVCFMLIVITSVFACKLCCVSRFENGAVVTSCSGTCKRRAPKYTEPNSAYQRAVQRGLIDLNSQHRLQPVLQPVSMLQPV